MLDTTTRLPLVSYELSFDDDLMTPWEVRRLSLDEALNECFDLTLELVTVVEVDIDALLGANAALTIMREYQAQPRHVFGVVEQIDDLGSDGLEQILRVVITPAFALLGQQVHSRIWQDCAVLDILDEVLGPGLREYGRSYDRSAVTRGQAVRDYCVQYRESDLDFVCRLLEEEGICYAFDHVHEAGHEVLRLFDENEQYPALAPDEPVPIIDHNPEEADSESIQAIAWSRRLTSTSVIRRDFDWREPERLLSFEIHERDARSRSRTLFDHGERRFITDDLDLRASDLERAATLEGALCRGHGNVTGLRPGVRFELSGHARPELDRAYLVTAVHHCGDSEGAQYRNEFDCVPADHELRPRRRTPRPRIFGPQTAIVTGDQDIHTDAHGRVKVQFHWERRPSYASAASCWIPCAQSWAGAGWGAQFIPRVGMQVVVEFFEGNPDDPLVTGCVYDGTRAHPFDLPEAQTQSGWRTRSSPDSEGFNELRFEDAAGREEIYVHGQRDWRIDVGRDKTQTIGNSESNTVTVNQTTQVGSSRQAQIGAADSVSVGGAQSISVGAAQSISVGGGRSVSVGASQSFSVGGGLSLSNGGAYSHNSSGAVSIDGASSGTVKMATKLKLECGAASIELDESGVIKIKGTAISLDGESFDVLVDKFRSRSTADTVIIGNIIKLNPPGADVDKSLLGLLTDRVKDLIDKGQQIAQLEAEYEAAQAAKEADSGAQAAGSSAATEACVAPAQPGGASGE